MEPWKSKPFFQLEGWPNHGVILFWGVKMILSTLWDDDLSRMAFLVGDLTKGGIVFIVDEDLFSWSLKELGRKKTIFKFE